MRLLPKSEDWTAYIWLVYLLFFLLAGRPSQLPATAAATAVVRSASTSGLTGFATPACCGFAGAWFVLGMMFVRVNPRASVFFVYAACLYGRIWEPPMAFRYLAGHLVLVCLVCWALGSDIGVWISVDGLQRADRLGGNSVCATRAAEATGWWRRTRNRNTWPKVAERERIARDLHDLLGHTLSLIVLKSEAGVAPFRHASRSAPTDEIRDVERISREALAQVRAAVRGYRSAGFAERTPPGARSVGDGRDRGGGTGGAAAALGDAGKRLRHGAARGGHQYRAPRARHDLPAVPASERTILRVGDRRQRPGRNARRRQRSRAECASAWKRWAACWSAMDRTARCCGSGCRYEYSRGDRRRSGDGARGAGRAACYRGAILKSPGRLENGREALDLVAQLMPDIVLTGYRDARSDGPGTGRRIEAAARRCAS